MKKYTESYVRSIIKQYEGNEFYKDISDNYDNSVETTTGSAHVVHPLSILKLSSVLTQFGFSIQSTNSDYRPTEIFYVGPGAGWNPGNEFRFNFPLIAVEEIIFSISSAKIVATITPIDQATIYFSSYLFNSFKA